MDFRESVNYVIKIIYYCFIAALGLSFVEVLVFGL